mmetsp:Transcript_3607/g.10027  ORF Transcript_3607/g.10027 Transcript_3607/m.10027 type:complete len:126 (+) Transcript_3607:74-451(+)
MSAGVCAGMGRGWRVSEICGERKKGIKNICWEMLARSKKKGIKETLRKICCQKRVNQKSLAQNARSDIVCSAHGGACSAAVAFSVCPTRPTEILTAIIEPALEEFHNSNPIFKQGAMLSLFYFTC